MGSEPDLGDIERFFDVQTEKEWRRHVMWEHIGFWSFIAAVASSVFALESSIWLLPMILSIGMFIYAGGR